jgi:Matrixin
MSKKKTTRLTFEQLEDRNLMSVWGAAWPNAGHVTASFVPDGTTVDTYSSALFQGVGSQVSTSTKAWQMEILRALQTWAVNANINIGLVPDGGQALGTSGPSQGDARFGDIRLAARPMGTSLLALGSPYDPTAGTRAGDIVFNSSQPFSIGGQSAPDLFTTALHEAGHSFGFADQNTDPTSVEYNTYTGPRTGLSAGDVSALQALYGARTPDRYEGATGDNSFATAAVMKLPNIAADITTAGDVDYYKFVIPSYADKTVTIKVQTSGLSLLTPRLSVYNASQQLVATSAAADPLSGDVSITLSNVKRGAVFYFKVEGARSDVFGIGGYRLKVNSGAVSQAAIAAIDILLNGTNLGPSYFGSSNDTLSTATKLDQAVFGLDPRFDYSVNAKLDATSGVDFFKITTPATAPGALVFTVTDGTGSSLNPQLTVYDANGNELDAQILSNDSSSYVVQVLNPGANTRYYVQVTPDAFAASNQLTGTYLLGANFRTQAIVLETLVDDTLSATDTVDTYSLQSSQVQLFHFVLSVDTGGAAPGIAVRMQLFDQNGVLVLTLDCHDGETISANVSLNQATYTARFCGASQSGAPICDTTYQLLGVSLSDPLDPTPTDPTLPPPPDPTVVTNPVVPPPTLPPVSPPWTPT